MIPEKSTNSDRDETKGKNKTRMIWPFSLDPEVFGEVIVDPKPSGEKFQRRAWVVENRESPDTEDSESFQRALQPFLTVAKIFALLSDSGICDPNPKILSFKIPSFQTFYVYLIIIITTFMGVIHLIGIIDTPQGLHSSDGSQSMFLVTIVFYGSAVCGRGIFLWLSLRWLKLQQEWKNVEKQFNSFIENHQRLRRRFNTVLFIVIFWKILEMILLAIVQTVVLLKSNHSVSKDFWGAFVNANFKIQSSVIQDPNLALVTGILQLIIFKYNLLVLNLSDIFIMLVSIGLTEHYKTLNKMAKSLTEKNHYHLRWFQLQKNYSLLRKLVQHTDNCISPLILLSYSRNLFYVCFQFCYGFSAKKSDAVVNFFSLESLISAIVMTVAITLLAAEVNIQSKETLSILINCPSSCSTIEANLFQLQMTIDDVALTGMKFFSITRKFMLTVVGVILTYGVIVLQFLNSAK